MSSSAISVRVAGVSMSKAAGQRRHDLRLGRQPGYVDPARRHLNRVLIEPPPPSALRDRTVERRSRAAPRRALRSDAAVALTGIVTFGRDAQAAVAAADPDRQNAAYRAVAEALARHCHGEVLGLVAHADEAAPHAHFWLDARAGNGASIARVVNGSHLQDIAADAIQPLFPEITRGVSRRARMAAGEPEAAYVHRSVKELHQDLPAEIDAANAEIDALRAKAATHRDRIARLEADGRELTAREEKRLAAYQRRLETAAAGIAALEAEIGEKEALASQARRDAEITAARSSRRRRLDLERRLAAVSAEQERLGFHQVVKDLRLSRRAAALETELRPLEAAAAGTDALAAELTREDRDEKTGNAERAAALDRREEGLNAEAARRGNRQAAAWGNTFSLACELIRDEIAAPRPEPGKWKRAARWNGNRWEQAKERGPALVWDSWPGRMWEQLRSLAEILAEPLRRLAAAGAENGRLSAELEKRPTADEWAALLEENSGLKARIAGLEPADPDDSPAPSPPW